MRFKVAPVPFMGLLAASGPVEMWPWIEGTALKVAGIGAPGCCPSRAQSRMNTGFLGSLRLNTIMWLPGLHAVSVLRLPTSQAMPVSHSHQFLWVPVRLPMTGLPPATVRTPTGWLGSVVSQISCAELEYDLSMNTLLLSAA